VFSKFGFEGCWDLGRLVEGELIVFVTVACRICCLSVFVTYYLTCSRVHARASRGWKTKIKLVDLTFFFHL